MSKEVKLEFKDLREAVISFNESGLLKEKIKLVGVNKEEILKTFMDAVQNMPDDAEGKFPGPAKALEFYNSILDAEEIIKKGKQAPEVISTKTESSVEPAVKPAAEKKEKPTPVSKEDKKISCTTRIMQIIVDNPDISNEDIKTILEKEEYKFSDATLAMQKNDTLKTINYIKSKKK